MSEIEIKRALQLAVYAAEQALRQWKMFSNDSTEERDIETDRDLEAVWYRAAVEQARGARKVLDELEIG